MLRVPLSVPNGPADVCPTLRVCDLGQEASSPSASVSSSVKEVKVLLVQSCLTLCDRMDYSPPGSSVHGILQARILEWVAISSSRDLPNPGVKLPSPALAGRFFTTEPPGKPHPPCYHSQMGMKMRKNQSKWIILWNTAKGTHSCSDVYVSKVSSEDNYLSLDKTRQGLAYPDSPGYLTLKQESMFGGPPPPQALMARLSYFRIKAGVRCRREWADAFNNAVAVSSVIVDAPNSHRGVSSTPLRKQSDKCAGQIAGHSLCW